MTRIVSIVLGVLAFGLFVRLWVGPGSYPDMQRLEEKIAQQNAANDEQAEVKRRLQMDVVGLSKDDEAVEE
ncbi:MAG: septum formation initiator family protein, partial [Thiothrix litoralis]